MAPTMSSPRNSPSSVEEQYTRYAHYTRTRRVTIREAPEGRDTCINSLKDLKNLLQKQKSFNIQLNRRQTTGRQNGYSGAARTQPTSEEGKIATQPAKTEQVTAQNTLQRHPEQTLPRPQGRVRGAPVRSSGKLPAVNGSRANRVQGLSCDVAVPAPQPEMHQPGHSSSLDAQPETHQPGRSSSLDAHRTNSVALEDVKIPTQPLCQTDAVPSREQTMAQPNSFKRMPVALTGAVKAEPSSIGGLHESQNAALLPFPSTLFHPDRPTPGMLFERPDRTSGQMHRNNHNNRPIHKQWAGGSGMCSAWNCPSAPDSHVHNPHRAASRRQQTKLSKSAKRQWKHWPRSRRNYQPQHVPHTIRLVGDEPTHITIIIGVTQGPGQ
eukprot:scpid62632/ scgid9142/ 